MSSCITKRARERERGRRACSVHNIMKIYATINVPETGGWPELLVSLILERWTVLSPERAMWRRSMPPWPPHSYQCHDACFSARACVAFSAEAIFLWQKCRSSPLVACAALSFTFTHLPALFLALCVHGDGTRVSRWPKIVRIRITEGRWYQQYQ